MPVEVKVEEKKEKMVQEMPVEKSSNHSFMMEFIKKNFDPKKSEEDQKRIE